MFSNKNRHIKILYQKKSNSVKPGASLPGKNTETADYNFGVKDIESLQRLLNTIERGRFWVRRNLENDIKALDGNKENLSEQEEKLLHALKNLQNTQEKINELKKVIQAIRDKHNIQATRHDIYHEMSSGERIKQASIQDLFEEPLKMQSLTKEQAMQVIAEMTKNSQEDEKSQKKAWINMKTFKRDHPDFGIMCFSDALKTDTDFLKAYVNLNHENMGFDEWNAIAEMNISTAMKDQNFDLLNFFFSLNKEIAGESKESGFHNTDQIFGMHMNMAYMKMKQNGEQMNMREKFRFARKFNFKEMEGAGVDSLGDAMKENKLRKKVGKMSVETFKKELAKAQSAGDTEKTKDLAYHFTYRLQREGKEIWSTLGEETVNIIVQELPMATLIHLHKYMTEKDDGKKLFEKFVDAKGGQVLKFLPNPHTDNIAYVIQSAAGNSEKLTALYKILRSKLAYMNLEKQKGSWWFSDDGLPKFIKMIENSGMTEVEQKMLLSQDLFVQKMKDGGTDLKESYEKYFQVSQEIKNFQKAMKTSSQSVKDQVARKPTPSEMPRKGNASEKDTAQAAPPPKGGVDRSRKEVAIQEYSIPVKKFLKSVGISESEIQENEELTKRIEGYFEDKVAAADILATLFQVLKNKKLIDPKNEKEIGEKCQRMMQEIAEIKIQEQMKKQKKAEEQAHKNIDPNHLPSHLKKESGEFSEDTIYKNFDTSISDIRNKIKEKNKKSDTPNREITSQEIIENYLSNSDFEALSPTEKASVQEMLQAYSGRKSAETDGKTSKEITEVAQGKRSRENYNLMRDQVLYHGKSVEEATEYANKTLGGPMGTIANTVSSSVDGSVSGVAALTKGDDPVALSSILSNGAPKGVDGYMVQKGENGIVKLINGDIQLKVPENQAMAYISNISLLEQTGLGTLVPHMNRINQIIATKNGKQISTLDGKISKVEAKGLLTQFADILGVAKFSENDGVAEMIARFQNDPHLQSASSISEKLIEKGIVSREGRFDSEAFKTNIGLPPSIQSAA